MGFFDGFADAMQRKMKDLYKKTTGRNFDTDYRNYRNDYEYKADYELTNRWDDLSGNESPSNYAERMAIKSLMDERGLDYD